MIRKVYIVLVLIALFITTNLISWNHGYNMGYFSGVFDAKFKLNFDYWKVIEDYVSN